MELKNNGHKYINGRILYKNETPDAMLSEANKAFIKNSVIAIALTAALFIFSVFSAINATGLEERLVRPEAGSKARTEKLHLKLEYEGESAEGNVSISIQPEGGSREDSSDSTEENNTNIQQKLSSASQKIVKEIGKNHSGKNVVLPEEYEGIRAEWSIAEEQPAYGVIFIGILCVLAMYFSRFDFVKKNLEKRSEAFENEIPAMVLELNLLLNSGLVVSTAFDQLLSGKKESNNPLYIKLTELMEKSRAENLNFIAQMYIFAQSCPSKTFLRIANMIYDQQNRGSELAEKLEKERLQLWEAKLQNAKAKCKEADTKLCFPLMLLLLALVIICSAPALLGM